MHWENLEGAGGEGGGGGIGTGNTCKPMAVSFQCMTKSTTNKKKEKILKKDSIRRENYRPICFMNMNKQFSINANKSNPVAYQKDCT